MSAAIAAPDRSMVALLRSDRSKATMLRPPASATETECTR